MLGNIRLVIMIEIFGRGDEVKNVDRITVLTDLKGEFKEKSVFKDVVLLEIEIIEIIVVEGTNHSITDDVSAVGVLSVLML